MGYESEDKINKFLATHELKTVLAIDEELDTWDKYMAWSIPQTVIINKNRIIAGFTHPAKLTEELIKMCWMERLYQ